MKEPCLLIHGFTGGPYEVAPLADYLEKSGRPVRLTTLPGHDEELAGLRNVRWKQWVEAAEREAQLMTEASGVFDVAGFSMGGLLAAHLACNFPVRRLVLLNAAVYYVSPRGFMRDLAARLRVRDWSMFRKMKKIPLNATWQFIQLAKALKPAFRRIGVPTFIAQSERDQIVHPRSARFLTATIPGEKELHLFPNSGHMICLDVEAQELFRAVERFLDKP